MQILRSILLACTFAACACSLNAQPVQVILIRHAEKPKDSDALHLSAAGKRRAAALPSYVKTDPELIRFGLPAALIASGARKNGNGQRAAETLEPLAEELHLPIETRFKSDEYKELAQHVRDNPAYAGKSILICWTHEYIPALAEALGIHPAPRKLSDKTYDRVYLIQYADGKATLKELKMPKIKKKKKD
jgi:hypothetical protein